MNLKLLCLIPLSISAAFGLYVFLQTNSETAQQQQGEISLYITQLEKMDLQLEKQLLVTDSFYFRNYDALNSAYYPVPSDPAESTGTTRYTGQQPAGYPYQTGSKIQPD